MTVLASWIAIFVIAILIVKSLGGLCALADRVVCKINHACLRRWSSELKCGICGEYIQLVKRSI